MLRGDDERLPDPGLAIERYRAHAAGYDASATRTMGLRRRTIALLDLRQGENVLDVACGTGLSFPLLVAAVGTSGRVVGVELSPEMSRLARERIGAALWPNVSVVEGRVEEAQLSDAFDAALFNFTHDVLQSPAALARVFAALRPGARVAASGSKLYPWWLAPANLVVRGINAPYLTTFSGLRRPWQLLVKYLPDLQVRAALWGAGYVASGRYRPPTFENPTA
jgi:demethylmenaquinone methyltransferase/2-methoxy-6-polyprenyl-1,4-benzoquinol methylase